MQLDGPARVPQTERKPRLEVHVWPEVKSHTSWCLSLNLRPQGPQESAGKASASISFNPEIQAGTSPLMNTLVCLAILNRSPCYLNKRRQTLKTGPLYPLYIRITFSIFDALISWDLVTLKELPLPGLTNSRDSETLGFHMQTSQSKVLTPTTSPVAFYTLATFPCSNHQCQIPDNQGQPLCPRANFPRACRNQNKESCSFLCPLCLLADPGISPCGPAWHGPLVSRHVWI